MSIRLAVFDCDGTLVDGQDGICTAMEAGFAAAGIAAPTRQAVRRIVGLSLPAAIRHLAPEADPSQHAIALDAYKESFFTQRTEGRLEEPLFAGIADLLEDLRGRGWLLAVATGKSDRGLNACLETHGLLGHFTSLQTADRHPSKPHPAMLEAAMIETGASPADTVMIGDTGFDMAMACAAGARAIGVGWGYHEADELLAEGAEAVARDAAHLGELL